MVSYRSGSSWAGSRFRWQHTLLLGCMLLGLAGCEFTFSTPATPTPTTLAQVKPPRINSLMAYDIARHLMVLFGGAISSTLAAQPTNQTWTWDGKGWKRVHPDTVPPALDGVMAYDAASQKIILLLYQIKSGARVDNQMWAWDGTTWTQLHPPTLPEVVGASMA